MELQYVTAKGIFESLLVRLPSYGMTYGCVSHAMVQLMPVMLGNKGGVLKHSAVGTATGEGMDDRGVGIRVLVG
jgi:hypothetical protein